MARIKQIYTDYGGMRVPAHTQGGDDSSVAKYQNTDDTDITNLHRLRGYARPRAYARRRRFQLRQILERR